MTLIDQTVNYGILNLDLPVDNANYIRNRIFHLLNTYDNSPFILDTESIMGLSPHDLYIMLRNYIIDHKICDEDYEIEALVDEIFGLLLPMPSDINSRVKEINRVSDFDALMYLKKLGVNSNYINLFNINKNDKWNHIFGTNIIEYTINLSKPEKSNKDIAKALSNPTSPDDAPKCVLCYENEGFYGNIKKAPRSTLRLIPLTINGQPWYLQFSPYVYYENHVILLNKNHVPMVINENTLENLISFVNQFPSFFMGSNADLPIVGGSILNHEHYQGGTHVLPIMKASKRYDYVGDFFKESEVSYLDWFNSTILIKTKNVKELRVIYSQILNKWRVFNDEKLGIISNENGVQHNTITPILRKDDGVYKLFLILRCNNTSQEYPDGIFHVHPEYFNIKKEGIGLIEAQGLFILPGRLESEIGLIKEYLLSKKPLDSFLNENPELEIHRSMIMKLEEIVDFKRDVTQQIRDYISEVGKNILINTAVFKEDQVDDLDKFMNTVNLKRVI